MRHPRRSRRPIRDILAFVVVALCALVVLAALIRSGAGLAENGRLCAHT